MKLLTKSEALQYVSEHTNGVEINVVDTGYQNIILVAGEHVYRFPRTKEAWQLDKFESAICGMICRSCDLPIPKIVKISDDPAHIVVSQLQGTHLSEKLTELSRQERSMYAKQFASFAYSLHTSISGHEYLKMKRDNNIINDPIDDWENYMPEYLLRTEHLSKEQQRIAREWYGIWAQDLNKQDRTIVVHDDLHTGNVFVEDGKITGVIDFGEAKIGSVEQELRHLYRADEDTLRAGVEEYIRLSGKQISYVIAKNWAIAHEIATFSKAIKNNQTDSGMFRRSQMNLARWLPSVSLVLPN